MLIALLIIISAVGLSSGSVFYGIGGRMQTDKKTSPAFMCIFYFLLGAVGYAVAILITHDTFVTSVPTLMTAVGAGVSFALAAYFYIVTLSCGPYTVSAVLLTFSNFISIVYCRIFPGDKITLLQLTGALVMCVSIFILTSKNKGDNENGISKKWVVMMLISVFTNSLITYFMRLQQYFATEGSESFQFYVAMYLSASMVSLIIFSLLGGFAEKQNFKTVLPAAGLAVTISANTFPQTLLYARGVPTVVLTPIVNGLSIIFTTVFGIVFFRDKLSKKGYFAIAVGIVAIVLLNI